MPALRNNMMPALVVAISAILVATAVQPGFGWDDDAGLYVMQARYLAEGRPMRELYESNRFAMVHSKWEVGPYLYPMGLPILLSPVYRLFGPDFLLMKLLCAFFFLASLPMLYRMFLRSFGEERPALLCTLVIGVSGYYVSQCDSINSDLPFLFFSIWALYLMEGGLGLGRQLVLGMVIFSSYLIRDVGVFLLPALFMRRWVDIGRSMPPRIRLAILSVPFFVFAALWMLKHRLAPFGQENNYRFLTDNFSWDLVTYNLYYYKNRLDLFFFGRKTGMLIGLANVLVLGLGVVHLWRRNIHHIVFTLLVFGIFLSWKFYQGVRFLLPVLPYVILAYMHGLSVIFRVLPPLRPNVARNATFTAGTLYLAYFIHFNVTLIRDRHQVRTSPALTVSADRVVRYLQDSTSAADIVGFRDPRALTLLTGRRSIMSDTSHFEESIANCLLIRDSSFSAAGYRRYLVSRIHGDYILLRKVGATGNGSESDTIRRPPEAHP